MKAHNLFIQKNESPDGDCPYVLIGSHDPGDGMDGEVAHVFGNDEATAEKLAREILDGLSVAGGGESGVLEVNEYQLMGGGPDDVVDVRILRRRGKEDQTKWAVVSIDVILNKKGEWEPRGVWDFAYSDFMTWDKYQHCYFDTVEGALQCWQTAVVRSVYDKPGQDQVDRPDDLVFLREIQELLTAGVERRDPTQIEYAREMIADWIDELETEKRPSMEIARDLLLLVHEQEVDLEFLGSLTTDELEQVKEWAALEHLAANDNDVEVPAMPDFLAQYFSRAASSGQ